MIGTVVNHYRITDKIGVGGMGVVYKAEDSRLKRPVAIKFISEEQAHGLSRTRFMQEARTASSLNHPHVCTVYDIGEFAGRPYIVMEFLEGETLGELLLDGPLEPEKAIQFAVQIAEGLEAAHAKGIIHRDIKPANVFITSKGSIKLLDFGIAKRDEDFQTPEDSTLLTRAGGAMGTVSYMSPEQALGKALDYRSDFFSLGVVLFETIVGRNPFKDETGAMTVDAIVHREPDELGWSNTRIRSDLRLIIGKLLKKAPEERYQSAAALLIDLRRTQRGGSRLPSLGGLWARWRWVPVTATLAILLLLGAWAWLDVPGNSPPADLENLSDRPADRPILAITELIPVGGGEETGQIGLGIAYTIASSLATLPSVTVISPAATLNLEKTDNPQVVARSLGAEYVITGAVQQVAGQLKVNLNLLKGDSVVWGGEVSGEADDLFTIQKDLVTRLTGALHLVVSDQQKTRLTQAPTENKQAYADYTQGRAFLERPDREENLQRALMLFQAALSKDETFSLAHAGLGETYWAMYERTKEVGWTEKARQEIQRAIQLDPGQAEVRTSLAKIHFGTGKFDEALEELRRAEELQPSNDEVHRLRGDVLGAQGDTEGAIAAYRQAIELRPNFWGNQRSLGILYLRKGRYAEATDSFRRITELQPDLSWGFHYLGVTYHSAGDLVNAEANYRKALQLGPSAGTHANLGTIYYRRQDYAAAAEQYEESLRLRPASETHLRNLGDTYRKIGNEKKATACYIEALELIRDQLRVNPNGAHLLGLAGLLEAKLGRHVEAARHADMALDQAPEDGLVRYRRAVVHALAGENDKAVLALKSALKLGYSGSEASMDDDLTALRERPDFQTLIRETQ